MILASFLIAVLAAVVIHELGHAAAAQALHLPWKPVLTRHGPGMSIGSDDIQLTHRQVALTSAGGPAANLIVAALAIHFGLGMLALFNLEFAVFNLIPFIKRSDGHRIWKGQHGAA